MPIIVGLFWVYVRSLLTLLAFRSAASGAPKECFRLVNLQAGSVIATVEVSAGMHPPPHMTCMYPPPHFLTFYFLLCVLWAAAGVNPREVADLLSSQAFDPLSRLR